MGPIAEMIGALIHEVAADDAAVAFGHDAVDVRMLDEPLDRQRRGLDGREVRRKAVFARQSVANAS